MKLLIVDDEELTRNGLIHSIDWNSLGINSIYEADDGLHGLELAKEHSPEIILSDVRMPRMDGVEMAKKVRTILPDCTIIFMSGYSDKAYLKAAIKLKAISYVEKPIEPNEIIDSVKEAISIHKSLIISRQSQDHNRYDMMSKLALKIIYPNHDQYFDYQAVFSELDLTLKNYSSFATLIIKITQDNTTVTKILANDILSHLAPLLKQYKIDNIYGIKQEEYIIVHLLSIEKLAQNILIRMAQNFSNLLKNEYTHFISIGKSVNSVDKLYDSYNTAIILMHSSFFYSYNTVLYIKSEEKTNLNFVPAIALQDFSDALLSRDSKKVHQQLDDLKNILRNNNIILVNHIKDLYYKLFLELNKSANNFHVSISTDSTETILDYISKSSTFLELHALLEDKINRFFKSFEDENRDNSTVFLIKKYVSQNYQNENLSIKDISQHVLLSSSYVCTVFKAETGKTLNQYLTEYRIEKAKKLLMDSRYKITDISAKVGYNDGNYFGKTFKKLVGLSPSEFRDQYLKGKI